MLQGPGGAAARSGLLCLLLAPAVWPATLDYQKIFGGNGGVRIAAVSTDVAGNVYVAGSTTASDFPVKDAPQPRNSGTAATVSRDGGVTWSPLGYLPEVEAVVASPRNASLLLAEGVYGVYRSTDAGATWTTVVDLKVERQRIGYTDAPQWDLRDASVAYVPSTAGVLKSVDAGVTWRLMDNGIEPGNCCTGAGLAIDPFVAGRLVFTINERAYVSRDAGASWTRLALPPGKPVWTTLFGGGSYDTITAIAQAPGGTLAIGGYSQNQTYVAKLAGDGRSFLFNSKVVGQLNSVAADGSGNVLAAGLFGESTFTNLLKFGAAGEVVSQRALPVVPERVAVDAGGAVYVAGNAMATGTFAGRIDTRCALPNGLPERDRPRYMTDLYVSKLDVFETLLGGSCRDVVTDLAVAGNDVVVTGDTWSDSFPVTEPLFDPPPAGYSRPFVARWNEAGSLTFSSYLPLGAITRASGFGAAVYAGENTPEAAYLDPVIGRLLKIGTVGTAAPRRVVDAFSRANMPVTAQEIVVVEMPGFRPAARIDLGLQPSSAPPLELGGVSVEFNGLRAGMLAVRDGEIECVTPAALEGQTLAAVQVVNGGARSGRFYVELAPVSPAIYGARNANGALNSKWAPAAPGSEVMVLFTGAGARDSASFTMPLLFWPEGSPQQQVDRVDSAAGYAPGMYAARVRMPSTKGKVGLFMAPLYPTQFAYPNAVLGVMVFVGDPPAKPPRPLPHSRGSVSGGGR